MQEDFEDMMFPVILASTYKKLCLGFSNYHSSSRSLVSRPCCLTFY